MKRCVSKSRDGGGVPRVSCCMCVALSRLVRAGCCLSARNTPSASGLWGVPWHLACEKRPSAASRETNERPSPRAAKTRKEKRAHGIHTRRRREPAPGQNAAGRRGPGTHVHAKRPASYGSWVKRGSKRLRITGSIDAGTYKAHVGQQCSRAHLRGRVYFIGTYRAGLRSQISVRRPAS